MAETLNQIDQQWFLWLNGHHSAFFDQMMFSMSGKYEWIPLYLLILFFLIRKFRWHTFWILLGVIILITLSDQLANVLKDGVKRFRPCKDPDIGHLVHTVNNYCRSSYGFVSGHAANSFALATLISLLFRNKWTSLAMIFWAMMVSYTRIYLGVHYPGDIIGGAILGTSLALGIFWTLKQTALRGRFYKL